MNGFRRHAGPDFRQPYGANSVRLAFCASGAALPYASSYAVNFISPRGSKLDSIGQYSASIKYATTLSHALYRLSN